MSVQIKQRSGDGDPPGPDALRAAIEPLVDGLRDEIRELREEVRSLRAERSEAAMLSVPEASDVAGISERSLRTRIAAGEVPSARIGRRLLVPKQAFHAWLDSRVEGGGT